MNKMQYVYGYHRCSSKQQHLERGIAEIEQFCSNHNMKWERIITDKQTGKNFERDGWKALRDYILRPYDTLIITEVDRLGRTKKDILAELRNLQEKHVRVMILELPTTLIDYSSMPDDLGKLMMETINNMLIEIYASLAEAEMKKKEKRQREGIEQKKKRGEWENYGRPRALSREVFEKAYEKVLSGELRPVDVKKQYDLNNSTYYRYCKEYKQSRQ